MATYGDLALANLPGRMQQGRMEGMKTRMGRMGMAQQEAAMDREQKVQGMLGRMGGVDRGQRQKYLGGMASIGQEGVDMAGNIQKLWGQMDEQERAETQHNAQRIGRLLAGVKDQESYDEVRDDAVRINPELADELPELYDQRALQPHINRVREVEKILQSMDPGFDKYYQTEDGGLLGISGTESTPIDLGGQQLRDSSRTEININDQANAAALTEEQKALARTRVAHYSKLQETALAAEEQNAGLNQIENMDVSTGFGEGAKSQIARVVNALGGDGQALMGVDPANVQAFNSITGKLVLDVMATQKGPQTDRDQERIAKTLPSIANEGLANRFNLNALKGLNFRRIEMADFHEDYLDDKGSLKGVDRAWSRYKRETPLLSDNVQDPNTGLPMFYHEFRDRLLERNPGATDEQVVKAWRKMTN